MCGVCGAVPWNQEVLAALGGSSLTWPCGEGNCYRIPLGFVGQAVIIAGTRRGAGAQLAFNAAAGRSWGCGSLAAARASVRVLAVAGRTQCADVSSTAPPTCAGAAIILVLAGLCCCRRCYVARRGGRGLALWGSSRPLPSGRTGAE